MTAGFIIDADLPTGAPKAMRALFDHWSAARRSGAVMAPLGSLAPWMRHLAVASYHCAADDVHVWRSGPAIQRLLGVDLSGRRFSEVFRGPALPIALEPYQVATRLMRPTYSSSRVGKGHEIARLILPLSIEPAEARFLTALYRTDLVPDRWVRRWGEDRPFIRAPAIRCRFRVLRAV